MKRSAPILFSLLFCMVFCAVAQDSPGNLPSAGGARNKHPEITEDNVAPQLHQQQLIDLNRRRQQQMKRDSDKLFQLASELKQYVDKTNENILSIDVLKKTEEIEKLAKSVREKMKTTYTDMP